MEEKETEKLDNSLKLIAKSSLIVMICILISKVLAYVYRIIIARSPDLGAEYYGLFSLGLIIISFFIAVASLGLTGGLLRYVSYYRGKKKIEKISHMIRFAMIISVITGIIAAIILFFLADFISINIFHNAKFIPFLKWFSISIPISMFNGVFIAVIQSYEKINWYSFIRNILEGSVRVIVIIAFIFIGFKTNAIIFSYILGVLSMLIVSYYVCKYKIPEIFKKYALAAKEKKEITNDILQYSWPLIFSSLLMLIFSSTDSFVIGVLKDATWVGIYNAAVPLAALLFIAPGLFIQLFFPLITKEFARKNNNLIEQMSKQVGKWIFMINLPIFIILILFPGAIINLFFGPNYLAAANSLRYLAIGSFVFSIFLVSENLLSMAGKSKVVLFNILVTFLINLVLDVVLVKKIGIDGAAIATMIVYIIWSMITMLQSKKYTSIIPVRRKMLLILLVSIIPTITLIFLKQFIQINLLSLIFLGTLFFLLYLFLIIITGCLDKNDLMIINSIKDKILPKRKK